MIEILRIVDAGERWNVFIFIADIRGKEEYLGRCLMLAYVMNEAGWWGDFSTEENEVHPVLEEMLMSLWISSQLDVLIYDSKFILENLVLFPPA